MESCSSPPLQPTERTGARCTSIDRHDHDPTSATTLPSDDHHHGLLGKLSTDVLAIVCSYLPIVGILALGRTSHSLHTWVEALPSWRQAMELVWPNVVRCLHTPPEPLTTSSSSSSTSSSSPTASTPVVPMMPQGCCWRGQFLERAETELNWRRGRPIKVIQQSLLGEESGRAATTQAIQSLHLHRQHHVGGREVLLMGMGGEASIALVQGEEVETVTRIHAHDQAKINTIRGTRDFICTTGMDHKVKLFDWAGGQEVRVLQNHTSSVWGLDVDESHPSIVVSSGYCVASLTDLRTWQPPVTLRAHGTWIRSLQVDLTRHLLVTGSCDATCKAWDLRTGRQFAKFQHPDHFEEVRSVQFQGNRLVTGCYDGMVREYDLPTGRLKSVLANHHKLAVECAYFYNNRCVSVDWSGLLCFSPLSSTCTGGDDDIERVMYGSKPESPRDVTSSASLRGLTHRVSPHTLADGRLGYRTLGRREPAPSSLEASMSSTVCCMQAGEDRLYMGRKDGRLVQLVFRKTYRHM